jgi:alkanesulfonate monooxygenase SsuD/methylene tetrahydromethanopterin reductase-like flavin-dependent oxidoreductase (luciferase family)
MKFGLHMPYLDPRTLAELGYEGEMAGWDGLFVWEMIWGIDAWISLAAVAMRTERMRLGTLITPLSRRRPWKVASEAVTLDHLSKGRFILPVGLGAPESGFDQVGEETDRKIRAQRLDESLEIITGLWSGQPFSYNGQHYQLRDITFAPTPVQVPRIPIWVVGAWPRPKSMRRVIRYDGILTEGIQSPAELQAMKQYIEEHRTQTTAFDIVLQGETPGDEPEQAAAIVRPWAEAGATWWLESIWDKPMNQGGVEGMRARIKQGPPRIS